MPLLPSFMALEHGSAISAVQAVKRALDPLGILNPGKVLPAERRPMLPLVCGALVTLAMILMRLTTES